MKTNNSIKKTRTVRDLTERGFVHRKTSEHIHRISNCNIKHYKKTKMQRGDHKSISHKKEHVPDI